MIGAGKSVKKSAFGNFITRFAGFAEIDQNFIRLNIDKRPAEEKCKTEYKIPFKKPTLIVLLRKIAQVIAVEKSIHTVEKNGGTDNCQRYFFTGSARTPGKYQTSV